MFVRSRAAAALERKKELFSSYARNRQEEQMRMQGWLNELKAESPASLNDRLNAIDNAWPGALPTAEFDRAAGMRIPFGLGWQSREQARSWALKTLDGRPVLAVDGSQIVPTTDYSYPVGAVQIGWFFNDRRTAVDSDEGMVDSDGTGHYEKDIAFEVLAPDELFDAAGGDDGVFPGWRVNQERFILECAKLCEFMESCAQRPFARRPVCFFDGSLIISFAGQLRAGREHGYIQAVQELLDCSERTQTPLVGYVDNTYSRDIVTLLATLHGLPPPAHINDASLLAATLPDWAIAAHSGYAHARTVSALKAAPASISRSASAWRGSAWKTRRPGWRCRAGCSNPAAPTRSSHSSWLRRLSAAAIPTCWRRQTLPPSSSSRIANAFTGCSRSFCRSKICP